MSKNKVHAVGHYKGHLKKARKAWNRVNHKCKRTDGDQVNQQLVYRMNNPEPLTPQELAKAKDAGLETKGQFCVTKTA